MVSNKEEIRAHIAALASEVAKTAGVDVEAAEKVLRALHVESHIGEVVSLTKGGGVKAKDIKLAYRISSGGMIA